MTAASKIRAAALRLRHETRAVALLEFGFTAPVLLALGLYGIETANYALVSMRISQLTLNLADNASRVGMMNSQSVEQLREYDMNDVLQAARKQGQSLNLTTNGRITVSSLENIKQTYDTAPVQRIHWQRCIGLKSGSQYDSSYGTTSTTAGTDSTQTNSGTAAPSGMGDVGSQVNAPSGSGLIFVEVNFLYQPLLVKWFVGTQRLHYTASYIVRDRRDFSQIFNPSPTSSLSTCNIHAV